MAGPYNINNKVDDSQLATAATADSVAQRTSDGSLNVAGLNASGNLSGAALNLTGNIAINSNRYVYSYSGGTDANVRAGFDLNGSNNRVGIFTNDVERLRIDSSGRVGIGTASPDAKLTVIGAAIRSKGSDSDVGFDFYDTGSVGLIRQRMDRPVAIYTNNAERMRITNSGNVGIGTSSPSSKMHISEAAPVITTTATNGSSGLQLFIEGGGSALFRVKDVTANAERLRIDSSGNVLVGKTAVGTGDGSSLFANGAIRSDRTSAACLDLNRKTSDGELVRLYKDGVQAGSIGVNSGDLTIGSSDTGLKFAQGFDIIHPINASTGADRDNAIDLGYSGARFDDIYATNGTIQTSDRNDKQDIEGLSEAEHRVAVACKSLLRKFRWKSSVEEKGDDARIHFGIIAQDLQAAFEAEGLDAGKYAMFIHTDWWEHEVEVPAVEAQDAVYETVTDEDGNETEVLVSEAVEAVEAYTRTDIFFTEEEAPEGAVKKSRMGVRYSELLAFIIAGI